MNDPINDIFIYTEKSIDNIFESFSIYIINEELNCFKNIFNEDNELMKYNYDNYTNNNNKKESLLQKIKTFFVTLGENIKEFFATIIKKIKDIGAKIKNKYTSSYVKKFNDAIFIIKDQNIDFDKSAVDIQFATTFIKGQESILNNLKRVVENLKRFNNSDESLESLKDYSNKDNLTKIISGNGTISYDNISNSSLILYYMMKINKRKTGKTFNDNNLLDECKSYFDIDMIDKNKNFIFNCAFNTNNWIRKIETKYNEIISYVKEMKKNAENEIKNGNNENKLIFLNGYMNCCSNVIKVSLKITAAEMTTIQFIQNSYLNLISAVISKVYKSEKVKDAIMTS